MVVTGVFDSFTELQKLQFVTKYSRWNYEDMRRETWEESVDRSVSFLQELAKDANLGNRINEIRDAMLVMGAFPSMRLFAMAGEAGRRNNATLYNCAYTTVDSLNVFGEILTILMSGTGSGYSVEKQYVDLLPPVQKRESAVVKYRHTIEDTSEGWRTALDTGIAQWWKGNDVVFDYTRIRPAGAPLLIKGGTASGAVPLRRLLTNIKKIIVNAAGRNLTTLEVHDIVCWIADCVVSGGVRRSALLTVFDKDDVAMQNCKQGNWWLKNPQRANANISINLGMMDDTSEIIRTQHQNKSGEPGIMSRAASQDWVADRGRDPNHDFGLNPCGEIILRPKQFCNLTAAIIREGDTADDVAEKVKIATWIGTIQSAATYFPGLDDKWRLNCEAERLLGVSLLGVADVPALLTTENLQLWNATAKLANKEMADLLGINYSAAITTIKPSGNSSLLFEASAGIQARWAKYYIRRVSFSKHDPVVGFLEDQGILMHQSPYTEDTVIAEFPVRAPDGAKTQDKLTAKEQLDMWLLLKQHYVDHNVSATITYKSDEIETIIDIIDGHPIFKGGISFLEMDENTYQLAPYEKISKARYDKMVEAQPKIDWSGLQDYEVSDTTEASTTLACASGVCILE